MILKKIKLDNIRSYLEQGINFPVGATLLSGDVGSGKSTILLAIDFVLFGLRKGSLSGSSLLRNGEKSGSVELNFAIDDKDVIIKRTLKRQAKSIVQDSGYITIDGVKKEGTATELKQAILQLLNYPQNLLTKSKSLIYRYTVYTPQEEMKSILLGDKDFRLDTLRKVFGIDKYKRIEENLNIFTYYLKQKRKEISGQITDLEDKKREKEEREKEILDLKTEINKLIPVLKNIEDEISETKNSLQKREEEIKKLNEFKKNLEITRVSLKHNLEQIKKYEEESEELEDKIKELESRVAEEIKIDKNEILNKTKLIEEQEKIISEINKKINVAHAKISYSKEIIDKISQLDICPLCKQKVNEEHINHVKKEENLKITEMSKSIETNNLEENENKLKQLKEELNDLKEKESKLEAIRLRKENLEEKKKTKRLLSENLNKLKDDINKITLKKDNLLEEIKKYTDSENEYNSIKEKLENLQEKQKETEIKKTSFEKELNTINKFIESLNKEIENKLKLKKEISYLGEIQHWLEGQFIKLVRTMEKKIMLKLHADFDSLFQKWFNMLMGADTLTVKLNEEFTPVIEQNGHDVDYEYLSGGEKTATALAYRLALNQIINTLISTIKTNDLLILDEPTDGFSTEQLDRVNDVINELDIKQIILVSHEDKIESFVTNVIKLSKNEHVTKIL